jgi:hypothetical protein
MSKVYYKQEFIYQSFIHYLLRPRIYVQLQFCKEILALIGRMLSSKQIIVLLAQLTLMRCSDRPWLRRPNSNNQYQFNDDENSWIYARERCKAQGADLVSITSAEEMVCVHICIK